MILSALTGENNLKSFKDELDIQSEALVDYVFDVQRHPIVEADVVPSGACLPVAGESGFNKKPLTVIRRILPDFFGQCGTRSDEAHIALEDIEQLRKLVNACPPYKPAYSGYPRVVFDFENRTVLLIFVLQLIQERFGVDDHASELIKAKDLTV